MNLKMRIFLLKNLLIRRWTNPEVLMLLFKEFEKLHLV